MNTPAVSSTLHLSCLRPVLLGALLCAWAATAQAQVTLKGMRIINSDTGTDASLETLGTNVCNTMVNSGSFWWNSSGSSVNGTFALAYGGTNSLQPGLIRFPGGSNANYWDWQTGALLPTDSNLKLTPEQVVTGSSAAAGGGSAAMGANAYGLTLPLFKQAFLATSYGGNVNVIWDINTMTYSADPTKLLSNGLPWSSNPLQYQVDMLVSALNQGLPVKYIELGNEFYLPGAPDYGLAYDNPLNVASPKNRGFNYANLCKYWINGIKAGLTAAGYSTAASNLQFALVGYANSGTLTWNADVRSGITSSSTNNLVSTWGYGPVSTYNLTFHLYYTGGFGNTIVNPTGTYPAIPVDFSSYSGTNWMPQILGRPLVNWGSLKAMSGTASGTFAPMNTQGANNVVNTYLSGTSPKAWFTEYNLQDQSVPLHGTWLQGLYAALLTLLPMENSHTRFETSMTLMGDDIFSEIDSNSVGTGGSAMKFGGTNSTLTARVFLRPYVNPPITQAYGLSAVGQTHRLIIDAARGMIRSQQINFPNDPDGSAPAAYISFSYGTTNYRYPDLYGFRFGNAPPQGTETQASAIVLNLTDFPITVDMSSAFHGGGSFRVRESMGPKAAYQPVSGGVYYPAYYPGVYLYGADSAGTTTPVELDGSINRTGPADARTAVTFPPYSITELYWTPS